MPKIREYVEQLLQDCDKQYQSWLDKSARELSEYSVDNTDDNDQASGPVRPDDYEEPTFVQG